MSTNNMPARIWATSLRTTGKVAYHRADIVERLVEALEGIVPFIPKSSASEGGPNARIANVAAADKVRSALNSYREATNDKA